MAGTDHAKMSPHLGWMLQIQQRLRNCLVWINNAGIIQPFLRINDLPMETAHRVMDVNFFAPLTLIKTFLPDLIQRPEAHILNVSSMGGYAPVPGQSLYGASKAALKLLTEGLRSELKGTNVGVAIAFPGPVATNIASNSGVAVPSTGQEYTALPAAEAAKILVDAIESQTPRVTVGKYATALDIISRVHPVYAAGMIYKQMESILSK